MVQSVMRNFRGRRWIFVLWGGLISIGVLVMGCAEKGLVEREVDVSQYALPEPVPDTLASNPTRFLILGDTQASWRAEWKFYRRHNWATWWQLAVPFYQLYLFGEGLVGGVNYLRQHPDDGEREREAVRSALSAAADTTDAHFLLHLGDMAAHDGRYPMHWERFLHEYGRHNAALLRRLPLVSVLGNHDTPNDTTYGAPNVEAIFDEPRFYVKDFEHASLFVIDSNMLVDQTSTVPDSLQEAHFTEWFVGSNAKPSWLERELEARADVPLKVVAMHHPLATLSWHERDYHKSEYGPNLLDKRKQLLDLLLEHNVDVVLAGHEHLYERNHLTSCRKGKQRTLHTVISSGGGALVRPTATEEELQARIDGYAAQGFDMHLDAQRSAYHFTDATLRDSTLALTTHTVPVDAPRNGQVLDTLRITGGSEGGSCTP